MRRARDLLILVVCLAILTGFLLAASYATARAIIVVVSSVDEGQD